MEKVFGKMFRLAICISILFSLFSFQPVQAEVFTEITTAGQLDAIRSGLAGSYRLMADIDLSSYESWTSIGTDLAPFTGKLDGNGKKITGLKLTDTTGSYQGLFGVVGPFGQVYDLVIENATITAGSYAGILAGKNAGTIQRCGVSGGISGTSNVGGLVGENASDILNSYSTATVTGQSVVGGLVGYNSGIANISNSYAAGPVLASVFNNYVQFDGVNDYIEIEHIPAYQTASFTLEAWFQWDPTLISNANTEVQNNADVQFIVGKGFEQFEIHTEGGSGQRGIRFIPIPRTSIVNIDSAAYHDVLDVIQPGWFHVAASYDFTNKEVRVYVNGALQDIYHYYPTRQLVGKVATVDLIDPATNPFASNISALLIGARSNGVEGGVPSSYFKGKIADVRFWNTVRTGAQIDADKNKQLAGNETGLMGYWKLTDGAGTTVNDFSGNNNDGALVNGATWVTETVADVGGLVGLKDVGASVTNSYYDTSVSGMGDTDKGEPKLTAEMKSSATFAAWNIPTSNIWQIEEGVSYPTFKRFTLSYAAGANGSLQGAAAQTVSYNGTGSLVEAVAAEHYHFVDWSDGNLANPRSDINVLADKSVTANFAIDQVTLNYAAGANGSLTGDTAQTVDYGSDGTFVTAVPDLHYRFLSWSDGRSDNPRQDTAVTGNLDVTANFGLEQFSLTYLAGTGGSLTGTASQTVDYGGSGTAVTAVESEHYNFVDWSDGRTDNPRTDTNVTADKTVTANFALEQFMLRYAAGVGGSLSGDAEQTVDYGGSGTPVTAVPAEHYEFAGWSDGEPGSSRTDANVTANLDVTANFELEDFTLNYAAGEGGTLTGDTSQVVAYGGSGAPVFADASEGYYFVEWSDGVTDNPRTDTNVTTGIDVTASFALHTYTLDYFAGPGGTLTGELSQTVSHGGSGTPVDAVPDTGYYFVDWSDSQTGDPRTDVNVTGNLNVTANFSIYQYTLTYLAGTGGTISGSADQTVDYGTDGAQVEAVPSTGYHFVNWSDGSEVNPRTDFNVTGDLEVTANFALNEYDLTYSAGLGGSLLGDASQTVSHGGDGTAVEAVADAHYHFVDWSDGITANPRTDLGVTGNINATANFALDEMTLTYLAGPGGAVSGFTTQTVDYGSDGLAVEAVPDTGYYFVDWSDGVTDNPRTDLGVTADLEVTANFEIYTFSLNYAAGPNGSLTGELSQTVNYGGAGTAVEAVAAEHYRFVEWSDGSTENPRTDLAVTENVDVTATFALQQFTLTYQAGPGGTLTGETSQTVDYAGSGTAVSAVPAPGYFFVGWSDGSTDNPRTDSGVTADLTVTAQFEKYHLYYFPFIINFNPR